MTSTKGLGVVYEVAVFRQDGVLDEPLEPVKPKKLLILVLGLGVGLALGVILALLRSFIRNGKKTTPFQELVSPKLSLDAPRNVVWHSVGKAPRCV